jgi:tetratricopeptide (TPR) repeat protein
LLENTGMMLSDLGDLDTALQLYSEALQLKEGRLGPSDVSVAATYNNMGNVYQLQGKLEKALEMYEKDLEITRKSLGDSHASHDKMPRWRSCERGRHLQQHGTRRSAAWKLREGSRTVR